MKARVVVGSAIVVALAATNAQAGEPAVAAPADAKEEAPSAPAGPVDLSEEAAPAPPADAPEEQSWLNAPAKRRCGFALGLGLGPMLGSTTGFPNDALRIDRDEFRTDTGFSFGSGLGIWLGIALADWFTVGLGPNFGRLQTGDTQTGFFSIGFHLDVYPAFGLGGEWENLGLLVDAGLGGNVTTDSDTEEELIESPVSSRVATGVHWEGIDVWMLKMGPFAAFDAMWSPSSFRPATWFGWRTTFYAGP